MSETLAINGGKPVFHEGELDQLVPSWPIRFPETEQKLIDLYRDPNWNKNYEKKLMTDFAAFQDAKYSIWMCNGTTTLECALIALGIGPGDEVIVPGVTWIATAQAPIYVGATPVIVDIDPDTLCIDPVKIEEAITPRTKAIIPVHLYSSVCDMDKINAIAKKYNLAVVEDCAHAHGAKQHGIGVGALGDVGSFSFQLSKLMTAVEGGCCTTNSEDLADKICRASHIGNSYIHPKVPLQQGLMCHQYRMTEFQALIISDQLAHQAELRDRRERSAQIVNRIIKDIPSVKMQASSYADDTRAYYFVTFLLQKDFVKDGISRADIYAAIRAEGLLIHEGWGCPLYKSPVWNLPESMYVKKDTEVSEDVMYNRLMCCSNTTFLGDDSVAERVGECIAKVMKAYTK
ncbi:MAG: DegT/DnrJ/EryC1/StrS family aminotransferase [Lentisphaerae bacterium]|nr:DegT/DnrJ/EryC1/StrS family aminotransferase [Lentisphaerota bacterium]